MLCRICHHRISLGLARTVHKTKGPMEAARHITLALLLLCSFMFAMQWFISSMHKQSARLNALLSFVPMLLFQKMLSLCSCVIFAALSHIGSIHSTARLSFSLALPAPHTPIQFAEHHSKAFADFSLSAFFLFWPVSKLPNMTN